MDWPMHMRSLPVRSDAYNVQSWAALRDAQELRVQNAILHIVEPATMLEGPQHRQDVPKEAFEVCDQALHILQHKCDRLSLLDQVHDVHDEKAPFRFWAILWTFCTKRLAWEASPQNCITWQV